MDGEIDPGGKRAAGFSLIELLVVIAVLAVLAVGVTLSVGRRGEQGDMAWFHEAWRTQAALAIEGRDMRGLRIGPTGLQVVARRMGGAGPEWQDMGKPRAWSGRVALATVRAVPSGEPEIVFLPSGQSSAFSLGFSGGGGRCESDGWTGLTCG